ncbi:DUF747-domain-containing protein [Clavulina sp. PMI_390]|nr:DUF747-domain-containing protein [Clavulina sp. PMI_390]
MVDELRRTYTSLPSSPIVRDTPTFSPTPAVSRNPIVVKKEEDEVEFPVFPAQVEQEPLSFSLWDYLREELLATDFDSHQELKWERVSNFLGIPLALERMIIFGCVLCFDSFLYTFTILPIRFALALARAGSNFWSGVLRRKNSILPPSQKADIIRSLIIIISLAVLFPIINTSKIYHSIRGQDTIKLYVIFNALEIADRLLTSIGQDILDCMFSRSTLVLLSSHIRPTPSTFRPILFFFLSCLYTVAHTIILVYQLISLNIAINAFDNSLLTLLLSNQFVEIKGSVFKKFEKDNLFQITCADIVERFQLSLMLVAIALRNLIELSASEEDLWTKDAVLPKAFSLGKGSNLLWTTFSPVATVLLSELAVDWLKHAFITKFNHIRPTVYERYIDVLCRDLGVSSTQTTRMRKHPYVDQSPVVARRLGFASLPLAILVVLIGTQGVSMLVANLSAAASPLPSRTTSFINDDAFPGYDAAFIWFCLVTIKLIIGINLLSYARRRSAGDAMERRVREDEEVNFFGRPPIGEGKAERAYNLELATLLNQPRDDAQRVPEMGERGKEGPGAGSSGGGKRKAIPLEELTRFTMVKRIW